MGVTGLWKLIEPCGKPVPVETLEGKILAVGKLLISPAHEIVINPRVLTLQISPYGCIRW